MKIPSSPNTEQESVITSFGATGFPTKQGDEAYFCWSKVTADAETKVSKSFEWPATPDSSVMYKGYCAGAMTKVAAAGSALMAALIVSNMWQDKPYDKYQSRNIQYIVF